MGRVILVRHGQASFGSDDYDRLSPLGQAQCLRLGEHWRAAGQRFDAVLRGTLRRHEQSLAAIAQGHGALPDAQILPALDEYDGQALVQALDPGVPLAPPRSPEDVKRYFRSLREALLRWMAGGIEPRGMPGFAAFRAGVVDALAQARRHAVAGDVLVVSSGGPISTAVAAVLDAPASSIVALNMRLCNSALAELTGTSQGLELETFNTLPHLQGRPELITRT